MAQVLKDEIRDRILEEALEEFYGSGYKGTGMRKVAERAKIPTGLIYSYYKNKEELFQAVLRPVLYDWERVVATGDVRRLGGHEDGSIYGLSKVEADCLLNLFDHRREFIIMIDKSGGTKYEYERERMVLEIGKHLEKHAVEGNSDAVFTHIVANNFVDAVIQMMYHYKGKDWAVMMLQKLSKMYMSGIGY